MKTAWILPPTESKRGINSPPRVPDAFLAASWTVSSSPQSQKSSKLVFWGRHLPPLLSALGLCVSSASHKVQNGFWGAASRSMETINLLALPLICPWFPKDLNPSHDRVSHFNVDFPLWLVMWSSEQREKDDVQVTKALGQNVSLCCGLVDCVPVWHFLSSLF